MNPQESVPPPQKTQEQIAAERRIAIIGSERLIPEVLRTASGIKGEVKIFSHQSLNRVTGEHALVDFVMADDQRVSRDEVDQGWTYFEIEQRDEFPEVKLGEDYKRILVFGSFDEINPDILFTGMLEIHPAFRGKGIGQDFQANLAKIARELGYKFICGYQNNADIAFFFLENGRYLLEEVKDELRGEFQGAVAHDPDTEVFHTVKILNPEDVKKYIRPERIGRTTVEKIDYKSKHIALEKLIMVLDKKIEEAKAGKSQLGDPATIIEII